MKFASNFGRYDDEWNDGEEYPKGDEPCMIILQRCKLPRFANRSESRMIQAHTHLGSSFQRKLLPSSSLRQDCWQYSLAVSFSGLTCPSRSVVLPRGSLTLAQYSLVSLNPDIQIHCRILYCRRLYSLPASVVLHCRL